MTTVYDRVKKCCDENSISIKALEEAVGLGNGAISHWKKGTPTLQTICKIADYFEKPVDYFVPHE